MGNVTFQKKVNGSMQTLQTNQPFKLNISNPNLQELTIDPSATSKSSFPITPSTGYNGFSAVKLSDTQNVLISSNIKQGVTLFGVQGNITGGGNIYTNQIKVETNGQVIIPSGYDGASNILVDVPSGGILEPYDIYKDGAWYTGWEGTVQGLSSSTIYYTPGADSFELKCTSGGVIGFNKTISVPTGYNFVKVSITSMSGNMLIAYLNSGVTSNIPDSGIPLGPDVPGSYYYFIPDNMRSIPVYLCFGTSSAVNTTVIKYIGFTQRINE